MKNRIHGFISINLIIISFIIGLYSIISKSIFHGIIYAIIIAIIPFILGYAFCSKCPCRTDSCAHIFVGKITKYLPERKQDNYSLLDYSAVFIPILVSIAYPQVWLWESKILLITFWLLFIIAIAEVNLFVCTKCNNKKCALCKNK